MARSTRYRHRGTFWPTTGQSTTKFLSSSAKSSADTSATPFPRFCKLLQVVNYRTLRLPYTRDMMLRGFHVRLASPVRIFAQLRRCAGTGGRSDVDPGGV